jgi:hypothetical protein
MLLHNLSTHEIGSQKIVSSERKKSDQVVERYVYTLIDQLIFSTTGSFVDSWISKVLMNITQTHEGRKVFLNKDKNVISLLLPLISHENKEIRFSITGLIKYLSKKILRI